MPTGFRHREHYGRILITRPQEQAAAFSAFVCTQAGLASRDLFAFLPMMTIERIRFEPPPANGLAGIIFTSANGVRAFAERMSSEDLRIYANLPVYMVGPGTAHSARIAGFSEVRFLAPDAQALSDYFSSDPAFQALPGGVLPLLFVRGREAHTDFSDVLDPERFLVFPLTVYQARPNRWTEAHAAEALGGAAIGGVTFFSERTARLFIENAQTCPSLLNLKKAEALCISKSVLEAVRPFWSGALCAAAAPDQAGMAELIVRRLREAESG